MLPLLFPIDLLFPWLFGYLLIEVILQPDMDFPYPLKLALSFGLGMGLLSIWLFILNTLRFYWGFWGSGLSLTAIGILLLGFSQRRQKKQSQTRIEFLPDNRTVDKVIVAALTFIALNVLYVFWSAVTIPMNSFDSFSTHAFNAKVMFYGNSFDLLSRMPHHHYPLLLPLLLLWFNMNLATWSDQVFRPIFPLYLMSFLFIVYYFLRIFISRRFSLFGLVLLLTSNFFVYQATIVYRDFMMMFYNCTTFLLILVGVVSNKSRWLVLGSLFAACMVFTKLEGIGYLMIHGLILAMLLYRKKGRLQEKVLSLLKFLGPAFLLFFFHRNYISHLTQGYVAGAFDLNNLVWNFQFSRILIVIKSFADDLFFSGNWNFVWLLFLLSLFKKVPNPDRLVTSRSLLAGLGMYLGVYVLGFALTQHFESGAYSFNILSRGVLHFFPLSVVFLILRFSPDD